MPIRAQVGSPDGVTKASTTPETNSVAASPMASAPAACPSSRSARDRVRGAGVDPRPAQPQPGPGGDEDAGQLEQPVRQDQPEEQAQPVVGRHQPGGDADVQRVLPEDPHHRQQEDARAPAPAPPPRRCSSRPARRTSRPARTSSSPRSRARPAGGSARAPRSSPAPRGCRPPRHRRPGRRRRTRRRPPPTSACSGRAPPGRTRRRTGRGPSRPGRCEPVTAERARATSVDSRAEQRRVRRRRAHHGQVGVDPLVERDQLVDLGAVQAAAAAPGRRSSWSSRSHSPRCAAT